MRAGGDRQPRRNSKSSSLQLRTAPGCPPPAPSAGFWGDQRLFPAPPQPLLPACPIQGQDLGFFWHWTGRRLLTEPSWGISMGRNLTSMPGRSQEDSSHPGAKHPRLPTRSLQVPLWHRGAASRLLHFPALPFPCPLAGAQEPFSPRSVLPSSLQLPSSKKKKK